MSYLIQTQITLCLPFMDSCLLLIDTILLDRGRLVPRVVRPGVSRTSTAGLLASISQLTIDGSGLERHFLQTRTHVS